MNMKQHTLSSIDELSALLAKKTPILYLGSKTSTVIPYDKLEKFDLPLLVDSSLLKSEMNLDGDILEIKGSTHWKEAKSFCESKGRTIMTSPTEELAQILSGVATSCTGERCFGLGTLRDQILELTYIDSQGNEHLLQSSRSLKDHKFFQSSPSKELLERYQKNYEDYRFYKNAPFPRLEKETDLLVGTEGQLGIITGGKFKTIKAEPSLFLFFSLPKWEEDFSLHLQLYEKVQDLRTQIMACELIDSNSWSYLESEDIPVRERDTIFLEVRASDLDFIYEELVMKLEGFVEDDIFSMPAAKCHELRMKIPRAIFERNSQMGVVKKGTDVQAIGKKFKELLEIYREMAKRGISYNLFGHFGDAHLHFNFMPRPDQVEDCARYLEKFYQEILELKASPFAEHGIGLLKQNYIRPFWGPIHYEMFSYLKEQLDPDNLFFPGGYMSLGPKEE
jgi:FAD/FMN-containing dehydrogenase